MRRDGGVEGRHFGSGDGLRLGSGRRGFGGVMMRGGVVEEEVSVRNVEKEACLDCPSGREGYDPGNQVGFFNADDGAVGAWYDYTDRGSWLRW